MNFLELNCELTTLEPWREIFIAELAEKGFESFVETNSGFLGYIQEPLFNPEMLMDLKSHAEIKSLETKIIPAENWNATWETNFEPVYIQNKLAIVAPFHESPSNFDQVITIMPKMSFGTGHHQTTRLVSEQLFNLDFKKKSVLDMGTGTGILAILAEKLGASSIFAPDIDEWSFQNASENAQTNNCSKIEFALGGIETIQNKKFNIILANINKNILIQQFSVYSKAITQNGILIISGFFETDKNQLIEEALNHGFQFDMIKTEDEWAMIQFTKA